MNWFVVGVSARDHTEDAPVVVVAGDDMGDPGPAMDVADIGLHCGRWSYWASDQIVYTRPLQKDLS